MRFLRILGLTGILLTGTALASGQGFGVQLRFGTRERPLEGRRYETMRALAHYLDERAQHAANQAIDDSHRGSNRERSFVDAVTDFAERARDFHRKMDRYREDPWDVPDEVEHLNGDAHKVNERIRRAHVFEHTWDDWDAVLDVLGRMNRVVAGQSVEVPMASPGWGDYDQDYGPWREGSRLGRWDLVEFRQLTRQLDEQAERARDAAEHGVDASSRSHVFLNDIEEFSDQTRALRERSDAGELHPREIAPTVNRLLEDARRTDQSLRSARVFPEVLETWTQTVRTLERMAVLVES